MNDKFYQDFAGWLDRWLQHNVGEDPQKINDLVFVNHGDELKFIAIDAKAGSRWVACFCVDDKLQKNAAN